MEHSTKDCLNLTNSNDPQSYSYEISKFPDGQQSLRIIEDGYLPFDHDHQVTIKSRLNTFKDLELIICASCALRELGIKNISLFIPYCIGGRSDRKFYTGGFNYIKQVIAPILNLQNFSRVTVFDPHSDVLEACINNFDKITNHQLVGWALRKISPTTSFKDICLISPDAGAYKKIFDVAQEFGIKQVVTATKVRDMATGKILHTEVSNLPVRIEPDGEPFKYVIIDDICDGGRTFIEIAKAISEQQESAKLYTIVSHGIFSSGYSSLYNYFEHIYTTNSVKNIVNDPEDTDFERKAKGAVSQYNLF